MSLNDNESADTNRLIYLIYERAYGTLLSMGAYASLVRYEKDGIVNEVYVENNEFEELGEPFEYESDDE